MYVLLLFSFPVQQCLKETTVKSKHFSVGTSPESRALLAALQVDCLDGTKMLLEALAGKNRDGLKQRNRARPHFRENRAGRIQSLVFYVPSSEREMEFVSVDFVHLGEVNL